MNTIRIRDYTVGPTEGFIFDTNVWIFLFGPIASKDRQKQQTYSSLLSQILSRKAGLYVTSLVIAEYINSVLRICFKSWIHEDYTNRKNADFKVDYRPTDHYLNSLEEVKDQVKEILKCALPRTDDFHRIDISNLLSNLDSNCDYNDAYLVKCCEEGNFKLVSDDKDMQNINSRITLLTK